jgi:malonate transporter and related proteins
MFDLIISSLFPMAFLLLLGYFAAYHQDFTKDNATILNKMVMLYALPLCLFSNIATTSIHKIIEQRDTLLALFLVMLPVYVITLFVSKILFKQTLGLSALISFAISVPAISFIGIPILGNLIGPISSIPIAVGCIFINIFQMPLTIILLSLDSTNKEEKINFGQSILEAIKQPIVWAPILALIIVFIDFKVPETLIESFRLLGNATGGVALFSSGIVLYSYKIALTKEVWFISICKNFAVPFLAWALVIALKFPPNIVRETVLTVSLPSAVFTIILSINYNKGQELMASNLFLSCVLSLISMALFIYLLP